METRIDTHKCSYSKSIITSTDFKHIKLTNMKCWQSRSLITFANAADNVLLDVLVIPTNGEIGKEKWVEIPKKMKPSTRGDVLYKAYAWNKSGWVSKEIWFQSVKRFVHRMKIHFGGRRVVLILDKLVAHLDLQILDLLMKNNIYIFLHTNKEQSSCSSIGSRDVC